MAQAEFGLLEPARERAIVAGELLGIDEHAEALVETERGGRGIALLGEVGVGNRAEPETCGVGRRSVQSACGSSCW